MITWTQNLKHLSKNEYELLRELCHLSKNVYNEALYNVRQHYFTEGVHLRYEANYPLMKNSENYRRLGANVAQQTMRGVEANFKCFYSLVELRKRNQYTGEVRVPGYLDKDGFYPIHFTQACIRNGEFLVPMSPEMKKETKVRIRIKIPPCLLDRNIHQIHIIPKCKGRYFEVHYIFDPTESEKLELDYSKVLAIDLGVNNFATCATSDFDAFIIDGRKIKSINQWYNKECARLSSIKCYQHMWKKWTNQMYRLTIKRDKRIHDFIYCSAKYIVDYCIQHKIGNIVYGYNDGFQDKPNLGHANNQHFTLLPFGKLKFRLQYLCQRYGINFVLQEESYTSKASFFDNDEMPVWNPQKPKQGEFSGERTYRGLYTTANGTKLNADVNAALNILRKSKLNNISTDIEQCRGRVISPVRIMF